MPPALRAAPTDSPDDAKEVPDRLAETAAGDAFWNAVARECPGVWFRGFSPGRVPTTSRSGDPASQLVVPLPGRGASLRVPVRYRSLAGRHIFGTPVTVTRSHGAPSLEIDLLIAAALVIAEPSLVGMVATEKQWRFLRRMCDSLTALSDAIAARAGEWSKVYDKPLDFLASEQALLLGHPLHPTAKSRDEFSPADTRRYSPEFGSTFGLAWFAVDPELIETGAVSPMDVAQCTRQLLDDDPTLSPDTAARLSEDGRWALLPAHPWQARLLLHDSVVHTYQSAGRIRYLGELGAAWYATSSVRSLYAAHSPWMLKCSLNLRLTNAVRTLTADEPARGRAVHRLMTSAVGDALRAEYPAFHVLTEPAYLRLRDPAGMPIRDACVLFRNNPFQGARGGDVVMMATLCQDDPLRTGSRLSRLVARLAELSETPSGQVAQTWFDQFLSVAVEPLLVARANFGLLFGAHQQNVLVRLVDGLPVAAYYRDCFGMFFIAEMYPQLSVAVPGVGVDSGGLVPREIGDRSLAHNLIGNNVLNVVATLGHSGLVAESTLLAVLRRRLQELRRRTLVDSSFMDYLLSRPTFAVKANFLTVLQDVDESRLAERVSSVGAVYADLPNPIRSGGPND